MLPPLRRAMSPSPAPALALPLGGVLAVFLVAVVTLAGATPLPRPPPDLPAADLGKKVTTEAPGVEVQHKRQIFREQVSPHTGGKIPEDAFRADRLALNKLQQAGFSVPDGTLLHWRGHGHDPGHHGHGPHGHPDGHTHTADPHLSVIKILQSDEGRYVPPEGQTHQAQNTVDSTYLLRTPAGWDQHAAHLVGLQRPVGPPLQLPGAGGVTGTGGGDLPRRPFVPQHQQPGHAQAPSPPATPPPAPAPPPPPPPPPPQQRPQDDVNLTPYPSPALQPPPPPPGGLYHAKQPSGALGVHPLELREDESLLGDSAFFLDDDWASELPGGLLSPDQLAALYNSDHEDRLQHLHSLTSF